MALIREDEFGPYVLTGGYAFRPTEIGRTKGYIYPTTKENRTTKYKPGDHVNARHRGGTSTAKVGDEVWQSHSRDPRYQESPGGHCHDPEVWKYILKNYPPFQ